MKEGWTYKTLGDVCEVINGLWKGKKPPFINVGVIRNANFTKSFTLRYDNIEYLDVEVRQYEKRKLQKGDLIVEKSGGSEKQPVGRAVLFEREVGEFSFSNFTSILRIKDKDSFNSKFLFYFLLFIYKRGDTLGMQKATTGIHNIEFDKYLSISVPVLPPAVQERIVERLDAAFAQIDELKSNAEKQLAEARALMSSKFDQILINTAWEKYTLGSICSQITDGTHRTPKYTSSGIPFLSVKNITKGYLDFDNTKFISKDEHELLVKRCYPEFGDILYTKVGTTGIAKVIDTKKEFSIFVSVALLKLNKSIVYNHFLEYVLNSPYVYKQSQKLTSGTANKNFLLNDIKKVELYLPSIEEQKKITLVLNKLSSSISELEEIFDKTAAECDALKQALLRQIFE